MIDPLNPGAQIEHSTKVTLSAGDWEIDAFLDDNAAIQESNEDDNTASVLVSVP
ncbi:MAG TPA: CARDB domain-containing protein [Candidatus Limnocylindrales bacterium]